MKLTDHLGLIFLSLWLILNGLLAIIGYYNPVLSRLLMLLCLAAGILILLGSVKVTASPGFVLLAVWLILQGIGPYLPGQIPYFSILLNILSFLAGLLLLIRR